MSTLKVESESSPKQRFASGKEGPEPWDMIPVSPEVRSVIADSYCVQTGLRWILKKRGINGIQHALNVAEPMSLIANALGLSIQIEWNLIAGGLLHDVGKASMKTDFSENPDRLTPKQRKVLKRHPQGSFKFVWKYARKCDGLVDVAKCIISHHEPTRGYPRRGEERRKEISTGVWLCINDKWLFMERRSWHDRRENDPVLDEWRRYLSVVDVVVSMRTGRRDSRLYISRKDPQIVSAERNNELQCFSSSNEKTIINMLDGKEYKSLVLDAERKYH